MGYDPFRLDFESGSSFRPVSVSVRGCQPTGVLTGAVERSRAAWHRPGWRAWGGRGIEVEADQVAGR